MDVLSRTAAAVCLLLLLSTTGSSEPEERRTERDGTCPAVCTCHVTPRSHVPLVRWYETGDHDHDSDHHWHYYHHHQGMNHSLESADGDEPLVLSVVCALQRDTNAAELMTSLPADTLFLSLLQAPDMQPTYLRAAEFAGLAQLEGLEIQGYHAHAEHARQRAGVGALHGNRLSSLLADEDRRRGLLADEERPPQTALVTLSDTALRGLSRLRYANLEHVLLSPESGGGPAAQYTAVETVGETPQLLLQQTPHVVPYEEFRLHAAPRYSNFANLTELRFLRLADAGVDELSWRLLEGLDALRDLRLERQRLRSVPDFAFYGCPGLRRLSLAGNRLLSVNMKGFAGLLDLETLDLSDNLLSQVSYVSLAPFPQLRELTLLGNPISAVYAGALEMMNLTEVLRLGGTDTPLSLDPAALAGLSQLRQLTVSNISLSALTGAELPPLPELRELELHGSVPAVRFDALRGSPRLERLDLSRCRLHELSQDAFLGLARLAELDLSHNMLTELPSELLSQLTSLREVYLHHNLLTWITPETLGSVRPKLLQLHHNPWDCSCQLAFLSAAMTNKARSSQLTVCRWESSAPGGRLCEHERREHLTYDARLEPRCHTPDQYRHWGLYEVMQRELRCRRRGAPPPAARSRHLHPRRPHADYVAADADDVRLLLIDAEQDYGREEEEEYEDYGLHGREEEYEDYAEAADGIADQELAMAEYAADDYTDSADYAAATAAEIGAGTAAETPAAETTTPGYVTISPELFARLSKKAQKLELERMNPKFRQYYRL